MADSIFLIRNGAGGGGRGGGANVHLNGLAALGERERGREGDSSARCKQQVLVHVASQREQLGRSCDKGEKTVNGVRMARMKRNAIAPL